MVMLTSTHSFRAPNRIGYQGALSIDWEDSGTDRGWRLKDPLAFVRRGDFAPSNVTFATAMQATGRRGSGTTSAGC